MPPPPTWTQEEEEEARNACRPPPSKRSCPEVDKDGLDTLPSWRDEFDFVDRGSDDESNKKIKASRSKPDADASRKSSPRSPENQKPDADASRKNTPRSQNDQERDADASRTNSPRSSDVLQPKKEPKTDETHRETDADNPRGATNAEDKLVRKERKSKQAGYACLGCGSTKQKGNTQCTVCHCALKREAVDVRKRTSTSSSRLPGAFANGSTAAFDLVAPTCV